MATTKRNTLHELGYKIFLDRYAQKDMTRKTLAVGDTVIVVVNSATGQREIGKVTALNLPTVTIELLDGEVVTRDIEHVDKPLETEPGQMMDRVAAGIAAAETTPDLRTQWTERFRWLLDDWKFVPGGRILTGAGTDQELTFYNCYVVPSPQDSRRGILDTLSHMTEIMSRGGGVGINISTLRPRHAYVKGVNGRSSGSVSWGALYSFVTGLIEQGGSRRGALMLILNDWHPDIFDFINSKRKAGFITNANISVGVSDKLMDAVKADGDWELKFPDTGDPDYNELWDGDIDTWEAAGHKTFVYRNVKARELWNAIIESAWASAEPGVWFRERSNKMANSWYFNPLISTNPCVTGDTRIYTNRGLIRAQELFDEETEIEVAVDGRFGVNQTTVPSTRVFMTGTKPVFRLRTKEGYTLRATADHRLMTPGGWVELNDLKPGDKVHILNRKGGFGVEGSLELGRVLGWLVGEGTVKTDRAVPSFFGEEKRELAPLFAKHVNAVVASMTAKERVYEVGVIDIADRDEARLQSQRLLALAESYGLVENKFQVPEVVFKGAEDMQRGFLQALFTADGSFQDGGEKGTSVRLASNHAELLEQVQQILGNFGIASRIYRDRRPAGYRYMPDSHRELKSYWCEAQHELTISRRNMVTFGEEIGFLMGYKQEALENYISRGKRGPYSETFTATVESVAPDGVEEVFDLTENLTHSFVGNNFVLHNCGEQPLSGWSVCNLGAINLAKFYDEARHDVAWEDLRRTVSYATRFLDNVIDSTPYFFEENKQTQLSERRIGLGTMGMAELMIRLGIRYGSPESVKFIDTLYGAIAKESYLTSTQIAREKGTFPMFEAEKFLESGYMQNMPDDVREAVRENGIRNVTLLTIAPTGCVAPDTLISTANGISPIIRLGDPNGESWQPLNNQVYTDEGLKTADYFYINGTAPVIKITTSKGYSLTATRNHQIRVIDRRGGYVWRRMDELQVDDTVALKRDTLSISEGVSLNTDLEYHHNAEGYLPDHLTPEFAELLGLYMGDGYLKKRGGLHIVVNHQDQDLLEHIQSAARQLFGKEGTAEERIGCQVVNILGYRISRFFEVNGLSKPRGNMGQGAEGAFVPEVVLRSGRECVSAFLRGLFESDGCIARGTITLNSVSEKLIKQVQIALLGLGIVSTIRQMPKSDVRFGTRSLYELRVLNRDEVFTFRSEVGFVSQRKNNRLNAELPASSRGDNIAVEGVLADFYDSAKGLGHELRQVIHSRIGNGALNMAFVRDMVAEHEQLAQSQLGKLANAGMFFDQVASLEESISPTYDLSVPENHTYIANGFVSHNTTGTLVNTSTGVEPFFSWVYYRKSRLGLHEEKVPLVQEWLDAHPGETQLPDYFVTAMELSPNEHVLVQGAIQRWIDSAISKTANVPNDYTVEQVGKLYEYMYELGCKGGTIYRDGSRDEQVLMLKGDERAEKEMSDNKAKQVAPAAISVPEQVTTPHHVYPRPKKLTGATVSRKTPFGTAFITMNSDEDGNPFEVFITIGKAGSDIQADAEGLGRMLSLQLRSTAPQNRREMLRLIIDQLEGIGGSRSVGFGNGRVLSLPDAVAGALREQYMTEDAPQQLGLPMEAGEVEPHHHEEEHFFTGVIAGADLCPECGNASLVREEGCKKCHVCGYSEC